MSAMRRPHAARRRCKQFGAFDIDACFNCGNCTAVCPLSAGEPRSRGRLIRYAQVGMRDSLLSSKELWFCYACARMLRDRARGRPSPASSWPLPDDMRSRSYDRTGLARTMYTRPVLGTFVAVFLAAFFALFMAAGHGLTGGSSLELFAFVPADLIHTLGIVVMVIVSLAGSPGS